MSCMTCQFNLTAFNWHPHKMYAMETYSYLCHEYWHKEIVYQQSLWHLCKIKTKKQQCENQDEMLTGGIRESTTEKLETNNTYDYRTNTKIWTKNLNWLIDWLIDQVLDESMDWLVEWLIDWLSEWVTDWLIGWLIDWLRVSSWKHSNTYMIPNLSTNGLAYLVKALKNTAG